MNVLLVPTCCGKEKGFAGVAVQRKFDNKPIEGPPVPIFVVSNVERRRLYQEDLGHQQHEHEDESCVDHAVPDGQLPHCRDM